MESCDHAFKFRCTHVRNVPQRWRSIGCDFAEQLVNADPEKSCQSDQFSGAWLTLAIFPSEDRARVDTDRCGQFGLRQPALVAQSSEVRHLRLWHARRINDETCAQCSAGATLAHAFDQTACLSIWLLLRPRKLNPAHRRLVAAGICSSRTERKLAAPNSRQCTPLTKPTLRLNAKAKTGCLCLSEQAQAGSVQQRP